MASVRIHVQRVPGSEDLPLPTYTTLGAAGLDLSAAVTEPITLAPGERRLIPTGIRVALPEGYEGQIRPRSGLALHRGLGMVNAPGTLDEDFRGELCVILINLSNTPQTIERGDRIAQLVIAPVVRAELIEVDALDETPRGSGGFGHTG